MAFQLKLLFAVILTGCKPPDLSGEPPQPTGERQQTVAQQHPDARLVQDEVELRLPLLRGRYISAPRFWEAVNSVLETRYETTDTEYELTAPILIGLKILDESSELFSLDKQDDNLIIRFAHPERSRTRLEVRRLLTQLTGESLDTWPTERGLRIPADFDPARRSVVILHGFNSNRTALEPLQAACTGLGFQVLVFDYPNQGPIAWSGARLAAELRRLTATHPNFRTAIIAHSMGGLVARDALECDPQPPTCVTDLVTLGTPHHGANMAEVSEWLALLSALDAQEFPFPDPTQEGLGEAGWDLRPGSLFLKELNARPRARGVRYHVAYGTKSFAQDSVFGKAIKAFEQDLASRTKRTSAQENWLRLLRSEAMTDNKGDGVVAISSARLEGVRDEYAADCQHFDLIKLEPASPYRAPLLTWLERALKID